MDELAILKRAVGRAAEELSGTWGFCPSTVKAPWPPADKGHLCSEDGDDCEKCIEEWLMREELPAFSGEDVEVAEHARMEALNDKQIEAGADEGGRPRCPSLAVAATQSPWRPVVGP